MNNVTGNGEKSTTNINYFENVIFFSFINVNAVRSVRNCDWIEGKVLVLRKQDIKIIVPKM